MSDARPSVEKTDGADLNTDIAAAIATALQRLGAAPTGFLRETPLLKLSGAALGLACKEVWLKLEHLQAGGSFKARGMFNRMLAHAPGMADAAARVGVPGAQAAAGVIIASGGNAGIATAAAAQFLGLACEVFVPHTSSAAKRARLAALGATVVVAGERYADALQACLERQQATGALLMHAYDQPEVVAGAATLAAEVERQGGAAPDSVLVSVGGGGLVAGIAAWFAGRAQVVALEPPGCPTLFAARQAGQPTLVQPGGLATDALGASEIGSIAWPITRRYVSQTLLVDDDAILKAWRWLWTELRLAVEPAAALGLAALQSGAYVPRADERVCLILCGANVDLAAIPG